MKYFRSGYTLIELLISVALGLIIVIGFVSFYTDQHRTNALLAVELDAHKQSTVMLNILDYFVSQAGYRTNNLLTQPYTLVFPSSGGFAAGQYISVLPATPPGNNNLSVRYYFDDSAKGQDCLGNELVSSLRLELRYTYLNNTILCEVRAFSPVDGTFLSSRPPQVVFSNIAEFRVTQIGKLPEDTVERYVNSNTTVAPNFIPTSIMIEVVIKSNEPFYNVNTLQNFTFLDGTARNFSSRERHIYRKKAVVLRNPEVI